MSFQCVCHDLDRLRGCKHAYTAHQSPCLADKHEDLDTSLHDIYTNVFNASINLFLHKSGWRVMYINDALGVLSCQGGCRGHSIAAMRCYHLLVCLEATAHY